jgi:hypothetical protein
VNVAKARYWYDGAWETIRQQDLASWMWQAALNAWSDTFDPFRTLNIWLEVER